MTETISSTVTISRELFDDVISALTNLRFIGESLGHLQGKEAEVLPHTQHASAVIIALFKAAA
ncbi:hypothetical protein DVT68_16945 [Dyella solisilvae]|uniref:Uncharacterized protein n=1 Tax=Dyella solisilvae TaxID=1920168 RepID=A0A370K466_9GAMM|nr:hypothetical protein [Dyella solisilvae]RDI97434.1 hypothetical protein DVT68_16945 [Dyella solisilvae]